MKKFLLLFVTILGLGVFVTGCGDTKDDNSSDEAVEADVDEDEIDIEDIPWSIEEGIVNGDRYLLLNYTNNTDYTLTYFDIAFKEKSSITEEEKVSFYTDIQSAYEATDEEIEELKAMPIAMHGDSEKLLNPGESVSNERCFYYKGYVYVKNINHYNLMEPDIATIKYVSDDNIYTVYYDYASDKYTLDTDVEVAYYWTTSDLGTKIPKPDAVVVKEGADNDNGFIFDVYGMSLEQFNAYVEECKGLGFTVEAYEQEGYYNGENSEGYSIIIDYDEDESSFYCSLSAPSEVDAVG